MQVEENGLQKTKCQYVPLQGLKPDVAYDWLLSA